MLVVAAGILVLVVIGVGLYIAIDNPSFLKGTTSGEIAAVTDATFDQAVLKSEVPVFVFFTARWCGPGRLVESYLPEVAADYAGRLKVCKVDVDANQATAQKYAINNLPLMLFFKGGQKVDQYIGAIPKAGLENKIDGFLGVTKPISEQNRSGDVPYVTEEQFDQEVLKNNEPVLVLFGDSSPDTGLNLHWCSLAAQEYWPRVKVCRVDAAKEATLAQTWSVATIPTMLIFRGGQVTFKIEGKLQDRWKLFDELRRW